MTPWNLPTALVIGADIGGIPLATRLARRSYKIFVFKKTVERFTLFERLIEVKIPDLELNIKFEIVYSTKTWHELYNLTYSAAVGLSHKFWQVGYLSPKDHHQHYRNLYFVGASTHPGTDLPIGLLPTKLTSECIFNDVRSS